MSRTKPRSDCPSPQSEGSTASTGAESLALALLEAQRRLAAVSEHHQRDLQVPVEAPRRRPEAMAERRAIGHDPVGERRGSVVEAGLLGDGEHVVRAKQQE